MSFQTVGSRDLVLPLSLIERLVGDPAFFTLRVDSLGGLTLLFVSAVTRVKTLHVVLGEFEGLDPDELHVFIDEYKKSFVSDHEKVSWGFPWVTKGLNLPLSMIEALNDDPSFFIVPRHDWENSSLLFVTRKNPTGVNLHVVRANFNIRTDGEMRSYIAKRSRTNRPESPPPFDAYKDIS